MTLLNRLQELVSLTGPSGQEEDVARYIARAASELADDVKVDALGNVIALRRGKPGERDRVVKHTEMYIDIGARSAAEVRAIGVSVGDPIGYVGELAELGLNSGRYIAHGLDDRAGCALLLHLLAELKETDLPGDLYAVFSVQEEVGLRGARAAGQGIAADVALAVDMTAADDTPDTGTRHLRLGEGPAVKIMDNSLLAHPAIRRALLQAAADEGIAAQAEILTGIGTDAGALHLTGAGVPTGAISVANRYTHSPVEMLDLGDLEGAARLLKRFVLGLEGYDLAFIQGGA